MGTGSVRDLAKRARLGVVFTRREALAAGISLGQLRGSDVTPVFRGVFTLGDADDLIVRARGAVKLAGSTAVVCETTGLALVGVDLPDSALAKTVHVWVPSNVMGPRMNGIRVHHGVLRLTVKRVSTALIAANPAECWLQAAATLPTRDLVVLADGLMRRQAPILFVEDLLEFVADSPGHRGVGRARRALDLARAGTDSPAETWTRLALIDAGLPCPQVNHPLVRPGDSVKFYLDMAYPEAKVAVEYDGAYHVGKVTQMRRDQARRRWIEDCGWRVITVTSDDLANPSSFVDSVRRALAMGTA